VPPQHPATGDVLDQALHVARTQAAKTPTAPAFLQALKPNSPLFAQTSRVNVARPAAQKKQQATVVPAPQHHHVYLGGGNESTSALPGDQAFIGRQNATDPNVHGAAKTTGAQIAREYVRAADTQRAPKGAQGTGLQGAALMAPNQMAVAQRGLALIGSGIPIGNVAAPFLSALSKLHLDQKMSQKVIGGIAHDPTIERKDVAGDLYALALARGSILPAHATTTQLLSAAIAPHQHHGSYWDAVNPVNIAKDFAYTPLFTAQGGAALGHATREALPKALGGSGNTTDLKAIGESQLDTLRHPGAFLQQHPAQAILAAVGAAKTVGGFGGALAKLPETSRDVTLSNFADSTINRGTLDRNLVTRAAQKTSDAILAKGPKSFQETALKNRTQAASVRIGRDRALDNRKAFTEYKDASKGIKSRREKQFLLQNAAQGLTPAEREAFYKSLPDTPNRAAEAKVAGAQSETFGNGPLSPAQQRYVDAARGVAKRRTEQNVEAGQLSPEAALRRDYQPLVHQRASVGDATATQILDVEHHMQINALSKQIAGKQAKAAAEEAAGRPSHFTQRELDQLIQKRGALQGSIKNPIADTSKEALNAQHDALMRQFADNHLARGGGIESVTPGTQQSLGTNQRFGGFQAPSGANSAGDVRELPAPPELPNAKVTRTDFNSNPTEPGTRKSFISVNDGHTTVSTDEYGHQFDTAHEAAHLSITHEPDGTMRIEHVYVRPNLRGTTLGNTMLDHALAEAKGGPIEARFENEKLGKVAERYFRSRGYTKVDAGKDHVRFMPPPGTPDVVTYRPGAQPFRVPMQKPTVASKFAYPGRAVRANAKMKVSGIGNERTFGDQLRSGNFIQNNEGFERQLFEPGTAADARKFVHQVGDPDSGLGAVRVHNGQELTDQQLENYELLNRDNLRTKPKNADKTIDAADAKTTEADITRLGTDLNTAWTEPELGRVPDKGDFVLVPKPVRAQLDKTVARVRPGSAQHRIEQAGHAFKTGVLMTHPTYPLTNLVGNAIQALPEGVGLGSYAKALRHSVPLPAGVQDAGFIAREFGHGASQTAGSLLDEGHTLKAINHVTLGGYVRTVRNLAVNADNFVREATYGKVATKEAKKLAGYNHFQRRFKPANAAVKDWLQKMADGDTPDARAAADKAVRAVNDLQGEYDQMRSNGVIDAVIPFHRWLRFVTKLMGKTLPLKYPFKTLGAYTLGNVGQQAAGQKGALPQYLADTIDLSGSPLGRLQADFTKTNPLTTFGTMFEPDKNGNPDKAGILGSLTPYGGIGYGLLTGRDFQTGNPLLNGKGKPLNGLGDNLRYLGAQAAGFIPPLGALAGGQAGMADTSIPLGIPGHNLKQKLPPKADGSPRTNAQAGPTVDLPWLGKVPLIPIANQLIPARLQVRNEQADQLKGFTNADALFKKALQDDIKAHITGNTPAEKRASEAKLVAKWQKIETVAAQKRDYFAKNPKALAALIASGTAK
jgi:predicted GNAT family acetyltransferase